MADQFSRTKLLIKENGIEKLNNSKVAIFGIGGVGSYVLEGLARAGVGSFVLVDGDKVDITNLNRQIIATRSTIGQNKVDVAKSRVLDINPDVKVDVYNEFFLPGSKSNIITEDLDYVVDCVDTVTAKIEIISKCKEMGVPVISSMGTGNKLDPSKFEIADIYKTEVCPLAKVMRKELRKRNIENVKVIFSNEEPLKVEAEGERQVPGSISFVPSVAGLTIAGEVVRDLLSEVSA